MIGNILVVGQSHVAAIRGAAQRRRVENPDRARTRVIHMLEPRYTPEKDSTGQRFGEPLLNVIKAQIDRHTPRVASCIGGNFHNVLSLFQHPRPFDFRLSAADALDPDAQPLPKGQVRAALVRGMGDDLMRLRLLADLVGPLFHLESPPPLRDPQLIIDRADNFFRDPVIMARGVAPAELRRRMWRLHSDIMRDACTNVGVHFLPVPVSVMDVEGFLDPAMSGDATHGNERYGECMIRLLENAT